MTSIDLTVRIINAGAALIDLTWPVEVAAIDDLTCVIANNANNQPVAIQPGPAAAVAFFCLKTDPGGSGLSYRFAVDGPSIALTDVHLYSGPGMTALLGDVPTTLYFTNTSGADGAVRVVVGRHV